MTECIHGQEFESCSFGCTLKKRELSIRAVKAFPALFEGAYDHRTNPDEVYSIHCCKCHKQLYTKEEYGPDTIPLDEFEQPCTIPTPIDINGWNVAMMLVRECEKDSVVGRLDAIWTKDLCENHICLSFYEWLITCATPADYILTAIKAKEAMV